MHRCLAVVVSAFAIVQFENVNVRAGAHIPSATGFDQTPASTEDQEMSADEKKLLTEVLAWVRSEASKNEKLAGVQLDGGRRDADKKLQFLGICKSRDQIPLLTDLLANELPEHLKGLRGDGFVFDRLIPTQAFLARLQQEASDDDAVAGVRVIDGASLAADGKLRLHGVVFGVDDKTAVIKYATEVAADDPSWRMLAQRGFSADQLSQVSPQRVLNQVRSRVAQSVPLTEVQVTRLRFDAMGRLCLVGTCVSEEQREPLRETTIDALKAVPEWSSLPAIGFVDEVVVRPSFKDRIQSLIAIKRELDGTRLDRAFYDTQGKLQLVGITARPEQKDVLQNVIRAEMTANQAWAEQISGSPVLERIVVAPLDGVLNHFRAVVAQSEKLGEVQIARLRFDEAGRLCLIGTRVSEEQGELLKDVTNDALKAVPAWATLHAVESVDEVVVRPSFKDRIQSLIPTKKELDGARLDRAFYDAKGKAHLVGITARPEQKEILQNLIGAELKTNQAWSEQIGESPALGDIAVAPFDALVQCLVEAVEKDERLKDVRLDRAFYGPDGILKLMLVQASDEQVEAILQLLATSKRDLPGASSLLAQGSTVGQLPLAPVDPLLSLLQKATTSNESMDGVRFDKAFYDTLGKLKFSGLYSKDEQLKALNESLDSEFRSNAAWSELVKNNWSLELFHMRPFPSLIFFLREVVANEKTFDGVRLDRGYFDYDPDSKQIKLFLEGLKADEEQAEKLTEIISGEVTKNLGWREILSSGFSMSRLRTVPVRQVVAHLQAKIATQESLDGVRLDRAFYARDGKLHFTGCQTDRSQTAQVRDWISKELQANPGWSEAVMAKGWALDEFKVLPLRPLLHRVSVIIAENPSVDECRVDRLFYDGQRKLSLSGIYTSPDRVKRLSELISNEIASSRGWDTAIENGWEPNQMREVPSLVKEIRNAVARNPALDGVRIDRAYYEPGGRYVIAGIQRERALSSAIRHSSACNSSCTCRSVGAHLRSDNAQPNIPNDQRQALAQLIQNNYASEPKWSLSLAKGWLVQDLRPVPLQPLLVHLQRVLPSHEHLDGVSVTRLFHGPDGRLQIGGEIRSEMQRQSLGTLASTEFAEFAPGSIRLENGVATDSLKVVSYSWNEDEGWSLTDKARWLYEAGDYHGAIRQLELAMRRYPRNALTWYFRALCYMDLGDLELARRDIARGKEYEEHSMPNHSVIVRALSHVQGTKRQKFEQLLIEAPSLTPSGHPVLSRR
jgi:tetratricopeptide (TPR) repeat protein